MKEITRHNYEKRIKELQAEVERYRPYRDLAWKIHTTVCDQVAEGKGINTGWILKQFWSVVK